MARRRGRGPWTCRRLRVLDFEAGDHAKTHSEVGLQLSGHCAPPSDQFVRRLTQGVALQPAEPGSSRLAGWASVLPLGLVAAYFGGSLELLSTIALYLVAWIAKSHRDHTRAMRRRCELSSFSAR